VTGIVKQDSQVELSLPQTRKGNWRQWLRSIARFMRYKPLGGAGLFLMVLFFLVAIAAPLIASHDPTATYARDRLLPPSGEHWLGTDFLGRDLFSRIVLGSRISIYIGLASMLGAAVVGAVLGVTSAYIGGKYDLTIQRFVDALTAFPSLLLALALVAAFGASINNVMVALVIVFSPRVTRVVRSTSLSIKQMPYVEAATAIGATDIRIMFRHVMPNTFAPLIIIASGLIGSAILIEASLSFLGIGTPGALSWGGLLSGQAMRFFTTSPWIVLFPGFSLTLLVFAVNVFGDALRDVLDPRLRGR
jgi:peptide/nickel transport system permease protein